LLEGIGSSDPFPSGLHMIYQSHEMILFMLIGDIYFRLLGLVLY
jgi:hypothetical protein